MVALKGRIYFSVASFSQGPLNMGMESWKVSGEFYMFKFPFGRHT